MATENAPPLEGWQPTAKPWDADRCCPPNCPGVCESAQHAVFIHGADWWLSDHFTLGTE